MLEVLYEDNHLIAINKPPGLAAQGDSSGDRHLINEVEDYLKTRYNKPGAAFVGLIHRLDRPVSGVVILAKTSKALGRMNEQFRNKETQKIYHAITGGELPFTSGTLEHWLGKDSKTHRALTYLTERPGAKKAILHYQLLARLGDKNLYEITLETGRFHQIRAQMSKSGAPLLGDLKYGAKVALGDRSVALHAFSLNFVHPVTSEQVHIQAAYPQNSIWPKK
ncbi:MAG: RluA family pseudouridine synthase [Bacteroidia bacterium]|nr:RluA family pseudouridine synthase [Bacteroidia bacterium]